MKRLADIKRLPDIIEIRKLGKAVISEAPMFAELLAYYGADAARCFRSAADQPDYQNQRIDIPAQIADFLAAMMLALSPLPRGRPPKKSTLQARQVMRFFGWSQREAARVIANYTGEGAEALRLRLVARSKTRSRKPRSPKPGSPKPRSSKPR
jgi:hypothetical protein